MSDNALADRLFDNPPILYFEIQSGVTEYPRRPVTRGRFLLGSGDACHMRLGGDDIPPIHSMIVAETDEIIIERLSTGPTLWVNGQEVESATIQDGDVISIGRISFAARFAAESSVGVIQQRDLLADIDLTEEEVLSLQTETDPGSLSVVELIDQLEADMDLVESDMRMQQTGLESLKFEANSVLDVDAEDEEAVTDLDVAEPEVAEPEVVEESPAEMLTDEVYANDESVDELIEHLNTVTAELETRASVLQQREAAYANAAEELLAHQARLQERVEEVAKKLSDDKAKKEFKLPPRKSA